MRLRLALKMNRLLAACLGTAVSLAQVPPRDPPPDQLARIEGKVVNDRTLEPLRRAHVVLRPMVAGVTAIGVDADDKGNFAMRDIAPGRYTLLAQRDGYLPSSTGLRGTLRMPAVIDIGSGQQITDLTFRLRPWAVLCGRIRYDDGEPAVNLRVDAYRQSWSKGRLQYSLAMSVGTDDRGEYRMHGLQPGAYVIAAAYDKAMTPGYVEQGAVDAEGRELPATSYATTFYPDTVKLSEAVPVRLEYGQEVGGLDQFLLKVRKLKAAGGWIRELL
jgi:hypothetical protein